MVLPVTNRDSQNKAPEEKMATYKVVGKNEMRLYTRMHTAKGKECYLNTSL